MPSIAVQSVELGPVTIPLTNVSMVKRNGDGTSTVVLADGKEMPTRNDYAKLSGLMTAVNVWGSVTTEAA